MEAQSKIDQTDGAQDSLELIQGLSQHILSLLHQEKDHSIVCSQKFEEVLWKHIKKYEEYQTSSHYRDKQIELGLFLNVL